MLLARSVLSGKERGVDVLSSIYFKEILVIVGFNFGQDLEFSSIAAQHNIFPKQQINGG
jgi:hypothetical protein